MMTHAYIHVYDDRKSVLLFSGSSEYRHRPYINACVKTNMGNDMTIQAAEYRQAGRLTRAQFMRRIMSAYAVLQLPGLGYDCFRLWETLLSGSMPVMERGTGLDRSLYKLPVLLVDDFADVTPELVRQAYVEALYRVDEWQYGRITEKHWIGILKEVGQRSVTYDYTALT